MHKSERVVCAGALRGIVVLLVLGLGGVACQKGKQPGGQAGAEDKAEKGDRKLPVATIGNHTITVGMLEDELNQQNPYIRMRFSSPERRKEFLKNLVRFEVLAEEAKTRGLQRDPEVVRRVKRAMIDKLIEELHASLVKMDSITDKEVADFYKQNLSLYQQPAKVRASWIVSATLPEAQKVLAEARKKPTDVAFFGELAIKSSTDQATNTKEKRGDLEFFPKDVKTVPGDVVEAVFAMKGLWKLAGPIKTDKGYAVVMKTGDIEATNRTLEQEKTRIKNRLFNEKRMRAMEQFVENLQAKAKVKIDEKALAKVKVDLAAHPPGMGPGGGPHGPLGPHGHGGPPGAHGGSMNPHGAGAPH